MKMFETQRGAPLILLLLALIPSCSEEGTEEHSATSADPPTNRLAIPPEVVGNLGITFAKATRGRLDSWIAVPGELYVPETHQWRVRAPARGLVNRVVPRWREVEAGEVVAELTCDELREAQLRLLDAVSRCSRVQEEASAAHARQAESAAQLENARQLVTATQGRFEELERVGKGAGGFGAKELIEAQRASLDAGQVALDAAVQRDHLHEIAHEEDLHLAKAQLRFDQRLAAFSILTGYSAEELLEVGQENAPVWKTLASLVLRAPGRGTVVEVRVSRGETVDDGGLILVLLDATVLRFRGWVPEGDLRSLRPGVPVRVELPGGSTHVTTELLGPMPMADVVTRRVQIEAIIPNTERRLPQGLSATAYVRVAESRHDEVLVAENCVVADGLEMVVFRRDPDDPQFVIRSPVELGLRGGGRVEVLAGLLEGDSVVEKGIYQLKQLGSGKAPQAGHFHADGSFHGDEH